MTGKHLVFLFPSSQNSISTEFDSGSICGYIVKTLKQNYTSKQKNHKWQNCVNKPTTIKITE